jgi:hypothetical protein
MQKYFRALTSDPSGINHTESNKQDSFIMCLTLVCYKTFALLCRRVGARTARASGATEKI